MSEEKGPLGPMRYGAWWRSKRPGYPFTMVTIPLDPEKVQRELPTVKFASDVIIGDEGRLRVWGFRTEAELRVFSDLVDRKSEALRPTVA